MNETIFDNEPAIRLTFFFGIFIVMALWELAAPRRELKTSKPVRWLSNLGIVAINTFLVRFLFPTAAVGMAFVAKEGGWGFFNNVEISQWFAIAISVIFLDSVIYFQHVLFHGVPALWRLHRVHHTDLDYDVTTGARFHPIEIILSMLIKLAVVIAIGAPPVAVLLFEIILNGTAMFNHSNVRLPIAIDQVLRGIIVTPDMHRVHHSVEDHEANSNFGFALSVWDHAFGTYLAQPEKGHLDMEIGIHGFRDPAKLTLPHMLTLPFVGKVTGYAINRRTWEKIDDE